MEDTCKHCGFDTPIQDDGAGVVFCANCGHVIRELPEVSGASLWQTVKDNPDVYGTLPDDDGFEE